MADWSAGSRTAGFSRLDVARCPAPINATARSGPPALAGSTSNAFPFPNATAPRSRPRLRPLSLLLILLTAVTPAQDSRAAALARAKAWLDARPDRPRSVNDMGLGQPKFAAAAAIRLWLAEIDARPGDADPKLVALERAVARTSTGETIAMGAYANWMAGFAAIPLIEKSLRQGRADPALRRVVSGFEDRQNAEGGWAHGGAGELTDFYPTSLVITTNFALFALGMSRRLHLTVDDDVVARGLALLWDVQGAGGAFPYGGRAYRKGCEAGRTASAIAALAALGQSDDDRFARAATYVLANMPSTPDGHASPAIHVMWGAVAASIIGADAQRAWDHSVMARVLAAQRPDGSFRDIVDGSPDSMALLGDAGTNAEYITALYAAALAARGSRIASTLRLAKPPSLPHPEPAPPSPAPTWSVAASAVALDCDASHVADLNRSAVLSLRDSASGRPSWTASVPGVSLAHSGSAVAIDRDVVFAFAGTAEDPEALVIGGAVRGATSRPTNSGRLAAFSASDGAPLWSADVTGVPATWYPTPSGLWMRRRTGSLVLFDRASGKVLDERPGPAAAVNTTAAFLPDGRILSSDESRLLMRDASGDESWRHSLRSPRGVRAPAWTSLAPDGDCILTGTTDGRVGAWSLDACKPLWVLEIGSAVLAVARSPAPSDLTLALADDGRLLGLNASSIAWTLPIGIDRELTHESRLCVRGGTAWVASAATSLLLRIDPATGRSSASVRRPHRAPWSAFGNLACVADGQTLRCWRLQ
jgi:outer membrane protein assembly factor BamB